MPVVPAARERNLCGCVDFASAGPVALVRQSISFGEQTRRIRLSSNSRQGDPGNEKGANESTSVTADHIGCLPRRPPGWGGVTRNFKKFCESSQKVSGRPG